MTFGEELRSLVKAHHETVNDFAISQIKSAAKIAAHHGKSSIQYKGKLSTATEEFLKKIGLRLTWSVYEGEHVYTISW